MLQLQGSVRSFIRSFNEPAVLTGGGPSAAQISGERSPGACPIVKLAWSDDGSVSISALVGAAASIRVLSLLPSFY